jgi:hypothetical protein
MWIHQRLLFRSIWGVTETQSLSHSVTADDPPGIEIFESGFAGCAGVRTTCIFFLTLQIYFPAKLMRCCIDSLLARMVPKSARWCCPFALEFVAGQLIADIQRRAGY